jgi:hypothetical protein
MLGAWWDRLNNQTPSMINQRFGYKPLSIWHSDVNITDTFQNEYFDDIIAQIEATDTNAAIYVTVYPYDGFDQVSESALQDFIDKVKRVTSSGKKMFIRYAPEMVINLFYQEWILVYLWTTSSRFYSILEKSSKGN